MSRFTTHILDTAHGTPAGGVAVRLYSLSGERRLVASTTTNDDGRTDEPLLEGDDMRTGAYELEFDVGDYFGATRTEVADPPFLGTVLIRVNVHAGEHYHVPLLVSPWAYSTYRGS